MELREYDFKIEESANEDQGGLFVSGYVNKTGRESQILRSASGEFREIIKAGAFARAIEKSNGIELLYNHDKNSLLGSTKNGSLKLEEDETGLKFECRMVETSLGKDVYQLVKSGLVTGMSFGFSDPIAKWSKGDDGIFLREIENLKLHEVSILRNPAYLDSNVDVRNDQESKNELDSFLMQQKALKERISKF